MASSAGTLGDAGVMSIFLRFRAIIYTYWAAKPERARNLCERMRNAGLTTLEISWDHWHRPYIRPEAVSNCLDACSDFDFDFDFDFDIESNLRLLSTRSHSYAEALSWLRPESVRKASRVFAMPVFATGRASTDIPREDFHPGTGIDGNCHSTLNLTVNAKGNVFPCCAGLDQTDHHLFGNVKDESIVAIAERMNRSPLVRTLVFSGVASFIPLLERAGIDVGRDYDGICHLCWSIFSDKERVEAIEAAIRDAQQRAIRRIADREESLRC